MEGTYFIRFLRESTARQSAYGFIWPLSREINESCDAYSLHTSNMEHFYVFCKALYNKVESR